jgi:2',3'-cyclic-nucleotide 2'-phosphodiesterase (5'-nucleotidase family)
MKLRRIIQLLLCLVVLAGLQPLVGGQPRELVVFFTGWVEGNFGPCGCQTNPAGGFPRRSGYAAKFNKETDSYNLHVDAGNFFASLGPHSDYINGLMIEGMNRLPLSVLNLAPEDLFYWKRLNQKKVQTRVISTNLAPHDPADSAPSRSAIIEIPAAEIGTQKNLKIGFLGISDPRSVKPNSGFVGSDPVQAIDLEMRQLKGKVDFVIVLADYRRTGPLTEDSLFHQLAEAHPEISAILITERRYTLHPPVQVNNAVILSSVERGRHLGQLQIQLDAKGTIISYKPKFIEMGAGVPEDNYLGGLLQRLEALISR